MAGDRARPIAEERDAGRRRRSSPRMAAVLAVAVTAAVGFASCGGDDYPPEAEANFMNACEASSGGQISACECAFDNIEEALTFEEFTKVEADIVAGGAPPKEITDAMAECIPN